MQRLFRSKSVYNSNCFSRKFLDKIKNSLVSQKNARIEQGARSGEHLSDQVQFQFPSDKLQPENLKPKSLSEEIEQQKAFQQEIANTEKKRLQELDKIFNTSTYFHDIEPEYEERLDSEHILERKALKQRFLKGKERSLAIDPQEKIPIPKIRNRSEFYAEISEHSNI